MLTTTTTLLLLVLLVPILVRYAPELCKKVCNFSAKLGMQLMLSFSHLFLSSFLPILASRLVLSLNNCSYPTPPRGHSKNEPISTNCNTRSRSLVQDVKSGSWNSWVLFWGYPLVAYFFGGSMEEDFILVVLAFIVSFLLAFGIGANDVANSFGTSVGSKVLTLKQACVLASIFEIAGAVLLGYKVSDTIRKGIIDVSVYKDEPILYMQGNLAALGGSAIWLLLATFLKMPISGTHSIVGAVLGFSLVAKGFAGINWNTLLKIVLSWFVSPLLSGLVSSTIFIIIQKWILSRADPIQPGLRSLPFFYGTTIFINVISILLDGPDMLQIEIPGTPSWSSSAIAIVISILIGVTTAVLVQLILVPKLRSTISHLNHCSTSNNHPSPNEAAIFTLGSKTPDSSKDGSPVLSPRLRQPDTLQVSIPMDGLSPNSSAVPLIQAAKTIVHSRSADSQDSPGISKLFSFLQILTAAFGSFAHGGNDVSNAIGPLIALWLVYWHGSVEQKASTPIFLLLYGGLGISLGLWIWGRRVIKTMGEDLTSITPSSGFTIEIGSAITVLCASKIGLPISTTHCKVGSVVSVGYVRSKNSVDWKLFRNIILSWLVTVPVSGGLSALLMWMIMLA